MRVAKGQTFSFQKSPGGIPISVVVIAPFAKFGPDAMVVFGGKVKSE